MGSDPDVARLIILLDLKRFAGKLSVFFYLDYGIMKDLHGFGLSITLFYVNINSITQCLKPGVYCLLYVNEYQICYPSSNMSIIVRQLQLCLNKLQQWASDIGFRFSNTKTVCMHTCQKKVFI